MHAASRLVVRLVSHLRSSAIGIAVMLALAFALAACAPSTGAASRSLVRTLLHSTGIAPHPPVITPPAPAKVTISPTPTFNFSPSTLTILVGTTVTWTNTTGAPHTVTSDTGGVPSSPIIQASGGTFSFTFTSPGVYQYHCSIHPFMTGTINVVAVG
jgi:plastocyanin